MTFGFRNTYKKPEEPEYKIDPDDPFKTILPPAKPVYDEDRQKRQVNRAKFNVLGQALTHIGDTSTLAMGGNPIKRKEGDQEKYLNDFQKYQDEYAKKIEDYDASNWLRELQLTKAGVDKTNQDNAFKANRKDADDSNYKWGTGQESIDAYRKTMTGQGEHRLKNDDERLRMQKKEQDERLGSEEVTYQDYSGKNVTQKIPLNEQEDIISRAKNNPYFKRYVSEYMKVSPIQVRVPNEFGKTEIQTQFVDEMGRNITDQDLLHAYLRYNTIGSPNRHWGDELNARQDIEEGYKVKNVDYGKGDIVPDYSKPNYGNTTPQEQQQSSVVPSFFQ